jgi:carboxyl-terminal processing protease
MKIDGEDTSGLSLSEAVDRLRGDIGSDVTLDIFRFDPRSEFNVTIKRAEITVSSVKGTRILEDGIGYIRITQFSSPTSDLLKDALDELRAKEMNALILDLRDNPGGLLSSAIHVSEQFINKGELVVSTRGRPGTEPRVRVAHGDDPILDIPMVILINQGSASASEIVAGALQDHKRAILLGERSFGKGSVQTILPLQGGSALRLTTAKYYTPSEKVIHENGLEPDVVVPVTSDEWSMVRLKMPRLEAPEYYDQDDDETKTRFDQVHDIQLDRAVDLVKGLRIYKERLTSSKR